MGIGRRQFVGVLGSGAAGVLVVACGPAAPSSQPTTAAAASPGVAASPSAAASPVAAASAGFEWPRIAMRSASTPGSRLRYSSPSRQS
jgi:hypothetical protein